MFFEISILSLFIFKLVFDKGSDILSSIEFILNNSSIEIFLLLKQEHVNLIFFLSLQNLIKGNL